MALLSPANPKFKCLSGGTQEQHVNASSTLHSYDRREQPNSPSITGGHLPARCVCFKCSRHTALLTAPEVTGARGARTGTPKKTPWCVSLGRVPFRMWWAAWLPEPDDLEPALGEHSCLSPGPRKELTFLPGPDSKQQSPDATALFTMCQVIHLAL